MTSSSLPHRDGSPPVRRRIALVGRLVSMSRREAEKLVRQYGGRLVDSPAEADVAVVADDAGDWKAALSNCEAFDEAARTAVDRGELEVLRESELWSRLGLVDSGQGVARLYTAAMLADVVGVPITAIRQWHRRGALQATRKVRRLAYFDFGEVGVARKLASLLAAGCTLSAIHRKLDELSRLLPSVSRPLADPTVVVEGRCLYVRRGESLTEPSGQLLIDFDSASRADAAVVSEEERPAAIPISAAELYGGRSALTGRAGPSPAAVEELRSLAAELDESGRRDQAIEVYRAILFVAPHSADDHFGLAELLYLHGDLAGARERYYMAIELDEDFVEARSNLGCVLVEEEELDLAEAAFYGALEYHPDYADAHFHLARLLDHRNQPDKAAQHWRQFLNLAPASPWADEADERIEAER